MKVKYKTTKDDLTRVIDTIEGIGGGQVIVGCLDGEHAWLAGIHEYGCKIPVTPKMRAFLHRKGLHLKESTTVITIPERSFIRAGHDKYVEDVFDASSNALSAVAAGKLSADTYKKLVGEQMASKVKLYARDLNSPPNHPFTVEMKGSSNPLVDTGDMIGSINYEVQK